jgi:hypothetical protein
VAEAFKDA